MKLKNIIGVGLLVFQVIMIVYARFVPARYYCRAPRDSINEYKLDVFLNGQNLNPEDIKKRYRIDQKTCFISSSILFFDGFSAMFTARGV